MKVLVVLSVLVAFAAAAPSADLDMLMAFDFDALLNNEEMRKVAFDCLLGTEKCGDFEKLRDSVVKVLVNKCAECNPEQKAKYDHVMKQFQDKFEPLFIEAMKKFAV